MTQTIYNKLISKINISKRYKNKIAIIYENKKISFNKLVANIDNLAQNLKKEKKKLNKPILVALENTDNYIYLLFAASKLNISLLLVTPDITIEEIKKVKKKPIL